ncbi:MAG: hypothetical protein IKJ91_11685 [Clostridia bacterium]|nr:hypothetical protein [Clostridia bacterium]
MHRNNWKLDETPLYISGLSFFCGLILRNYYVFFVGLALSLAWVGVCCFFQSMYYITRKKARIIRYEAKLGAKFVFGGKTNKNDYDNGVYIILLCFFVASLLKNEDKCNNGDEDINSFTDCNKKIENLIIKSLKEYQIYYMGIIDYIKGVVSKMPDDIFYNVAEFSKIIVEFIKEESLEHGESITLDNISYYNRLKLFSIKLFRDEYKAPISFCGAIHKYI